MDSPATARSSRPAAQDFDFASAVDAAEAIRTRKISSVELTQRVFERIDRHNPALNAFCYQMREEGRRRNEPTKRWRKASRSGRFTACPST